TDELETRGYARVPVDRASGGSTWRSHTLYGHTPLWFDGSNYDAGALPASFCVNGSQDLLVTHTLTPASGYCRMPQRQRPPRQRLCSNGLIGPLCTGLLPLGAHRSPALAAV